MAPRGAERRRRDRWRARALLDHGRGLDDKRGAVTDDLTADTVLAALDSLPVRRRSVLALRHVDEHSVSEVAEALALSYRATESLLARARRSFRAAYEELAP